MAGDWTGEAGRAAASGSLRVQRALQWGDIMTAIVNGESDQTFDALRPLIDESRFVRRGNERGGEMDWPTYRKMLGQWAVHSGRYEKTLHRVSEVGDVVYLDLDEYPTAKDGSVNPLRSISLYQFDDQDRIVSVDVIMGFFQPQG
jgi:hypothetical protein